MFNRPSLCDNQYLTFEHAPPRIILVCHAPQHLQPIPPAHRQFNGLADEKGEVTLSHLRWFRRGKGDHVAIQVEANLIADEVDGHTDDGPSWPDRRFFVVRCQNETGPA